MPDALEYYEPLIVFFAIVVLAMIWGRVFAKAGYSAWLGVTIFVPLVNLVVLIWFAMADWPILSELSKLKDASGHPISPPLRSATIGYMPSDDFTTNLLRAIAAELHYANLLRASRDRCATSIDRLTREQIGALQQAVLADVGALYNLLTPAYLSTPGSTEGPPFGTPPGSMLQ